MPLIVAVLVTAAAAAVYLVFGLRTQEPAAPQAAVAPPAEASKPAEATRPLGGEAAPIALPPLDETDPVVRDLVRKLSSHPRVVAWLATDGLIRNFTVVVTNVADGGPVTPLLRTVRPSAAFRVLEFGDELLIDPRSYQRYADLAAAVGALDPRETARLYSMLKPRIEDAYRDLGETRRPFDAALERAIVELLETPVPPGPLRVEPRGIVYGFADRKLETLAPAQRLLLRMGPEHARAIQIKLHAIGVALGIPPARLPSP